MHKFPRNRLGYILFFFFCIKSRSLLHDSSSSSLSSSLDFFIFSHSLSFRFSRTHTALDPVFFFSGRKIYVEEVRACVARAAAEGTRHVAAPTHSHTLTGGRGRRAPAAITELYIYCAIPVVSARRIVPPPHPKKPSTTKQSTPQQTSRCVASVACSCRRYTLRAGLSLSLPSILYLLYSF